MTQPTRDELAEALKALVEETIKDVPGPGYRADGNAPGHAHRVRGVWDRDNPPERAGKPCTLCTAWNRAVALRDQLLLEKAAPKPAAMTKATITEVRRVVEAHGALQGIVLLFDDRRFVSASYGTTKALCVRVGKTLDAIADGIRDGRIQTP